MKRNKGFCQELNNIMHGSEITGVVFDIQPFSVHDDLGTRTLIFLKGCPLCCDWCSHPEGHHPFPQLLYKKELCQPDCTICRDETGAVHNAGKIITTFESEPHCPYNATEVCGYEISVEGMMAYIRNDQPHFGDTGGIILTGGEPFCQPKFIRALLEECWKIGVSTAIKTSLYASFCDIEKVLPFINYFMFDIKMMDPEKHYKYCGVDNELILENIRHLAQTSQVPLLPRMPVIPGINDDEENIRKTAEFLSDIDLRYINLLPYKRYGEAVYEQLGMKDERSQLRPPTPEEIQRITDIFYQHDVFCL